MFLRGEIGGAQVTLANIYAPNSHQDRFIVKTLEALLEFSRGHLIIGGDFNLPLIPSEDTSSGTSSITPVARKRIARALHKAHLIDAWRLLHPTELDYTFYSKPYKQYSRIDYFLLPHAQLHALRDSKIGSITWSDHAPVLLTYALTDHPTDGQRTWRLNESLMHDDEVLTDVRKDMIFTSKQTTLLTVILELSGRHIKW